jgi:protoheme IX farnesyltransferase
MVRTKNRALPAHKISVTSAAIFSAVMGLIGFTLLIVFTNILVVSIILGAYFFYVVLYGFAKRRSVHGTLVGSIPGAAPPVAGYLAVTDQVDASAVIIFLAMVFWQMPHFYAIAMYRFKDYRAAGLPVLAVKKGMSTSKQQIMAYIVLFTITAGSLTLYGNSGRIYFLTILALGIYWFIKGIKRYNTQSPADWGRKMFLASLIVNLGFSLSIAVLSHLP